MGASNEECYFGAMYCVTLRPATCDRIAGWSAASQLSTDVGIYVPLIVRLAIRFLGRRATSAVYFPYRLQYGFPFTDSYPIRPAKGLLVLHVYHVLPVHKLTILPSCGRHCCWI